MSKPSKLSRRRFVTSISTAAALAVSAPTVLTASRTRDTRITGSDDFTFEIQHDWPQLPDKYTWQTTHNVAIDKAGNLYVIHEGIPQWKDHPSIFVFDPTGKFIQAFGSEFQGGGHGLEIRDEDGTEFIYVAAYQQVKAIAKLDLNGNIVWYRRAPMESGVYAVDEDKSTVAQWGRDRFLPTNFAFLPDGDFLLADGYGSYYIHRYNKDGHWKSCFGGPGDGNGKFNTPHGLWVDSRLEGNLRLVVTDRAHDTLQFLTLAGEHIETKAGFGLPANIDAFQGWLLVPELKARLSILNRDNHVAAVLGDDFERITGEGGNSIRNDSSLWRPNRFVHPHDACFDGNGNIFVAEWVRTGRISRLRRV